MNDCIACDSKLIKINEFVSKCKRCDFLKSNLKPGFGREIEGITELRKKNFRKIINKIISFNNSKDFKILEIGSGSGFFIEECEKYNLSITGSEADFNQLITLKKKFPKTIKIALPLNKNETYNIGKYDIIIFNDVFEHLSNLDSVISQLSNLLEKNGKIIINLPSSDGIIFKISSLLYKLGIKNFYNRLWQKNLSSPHLSYFNNVNLKYLLEKFGYKLIYADSLDTVSNTGNFKRLNSTIDNKFTCIILSIILILFYFIQKILPKDIIFHIYSKKF